MDYDRFVEQVEIESGLERADAASTAQAVLRRLGLRLTAGEAHNLAASLPHEFQDVVSRSPAEERPQIMDESGFAAAVAEDLRIDAREAQRRARVVFAVLYRALDPADFKAVVSQLPEDLATLAADAGDRA